MSAIYDGVILSNAASANEQINEMPIATSTNKMSSSTLLALGSAIASAAQTVCGSSVIAVNNRKDLILNRVSLRIVGGGSADASLRQARRRYKRGTDIKEVNKLGNLNKEEKGSHNISWADGSR